MDWETHLEKTPIQKIEKTVKIRGKLPHVNKKPLARKRITPISHSTLNSERKSSRRKPTRFFALLPVSAWPKSLLQFDFKNHENVWTDLNKNIAGQVLTYNSKNFHWLNRKLDLERTMNGLGNPFRKNSDPKIRKNRKIRVKLPHVNKKPLARKRIFVQTPFSHCTLNLERKNFTPQNHSLFRSTSCFGVTIITTPIWLQ